MNIELTQSLQNRITVYGGAGMIIAFEEVAVTGFPGAELRAKMVIKVLPRRFIGWCAGMADIFTSPQ